MSTFKEIVSFLPADLVEDVLIEYDLNDPAHMRQHAIDVVCHADEIIKKYPDTLESSRITIITAALLHDIKCHVDRDLHHVLGAMCVEKMLFNYDIKIMIEVQEDRRHLDEDCITQLSWDEVEEIKMAILAHRASWTHKRGSVVSDVVAAADRGKPDMFKYIRRAVLFRAAHVDESVLPLSKQMKLSIVNESIQHIKEKYGSGGYVYKSLPRYTGLMYNKELENIRLTLECDTNSLRTFAMDNFDKWVGVCQK